LLLTSSAWGTDYFVATTGNDTTGTGAIGAPWATIAKGLSSMNMSGGDTLYLRAGTYTQQILHGMAIPGGSSWGNAGRISRYQNEVVTLKGVVGSTTQVMRFIGADDSWFIVSGIILDGVGSSSDVVKIEQGAHHIRFEDCEIKNSKGQGVLISGGEATHHNEFKRCNIHHNGSNTANPLDHGLYIAGVDTLVDSCDVHDQAFGYGIHIYDGLGAADGNRNIIIRNKSHHNAESGIIFARGDNNLAYDKLVYANTEHGILVSLGDAENHDNKVYNNTAWGNGISGITVHPSANTAQVKNNIAYNNPTNILNQGVNSTLTTNRTTDPSFADASSGDFSLVAGSPAINAGTVLSATLGVSFLYNGSAPDQGAHETFTCAATANILDTVSDTTLTLTCTNNLNTPLLPATGCAGFTLLKNTVNHSVTCARTGDNTLTFTSTSGTPFVSGDTNVTLAYSTTAGNVTNSALIGNAANQRLFTISPAIPVNNPLSGGSAPVLEQIAFQFRCVGGDEDTPDCVKPINTNITIPPGASTVVRGQISNTVADFTSSGYTVCAQKNGSGGYTQVGNGPTPATGLSFVTGTGSFPPELVAGPTTNQLGSSPFKVGGVQLNGSATPDVSLAVGEETELVAVLVVGSGNANGAFFDLHWCRDGGVALTTYTQTPRITVVTDGYVYQEGAR
jgi:hypothetical protein